MIHTCPAGLPAVFIRPIINISVALFIFCSGFLTKTDSRDWNSHCKRRILRVLWPYITWSIIYTIAHNNYSDFIKNILTARADFLLYYIFVYIELVLVTPLVKMLLLSKYRVLGLLFSPMAILLMNYILPEFGINLSEYCGTTLIGWVSYYFLGMALGNNIFSINIQTSKLFILYIIALFFSLLEGLYWFYDSDYEMALTQVKLTTFIANVFFMFVASRYITDDSINIRNVNIENALVNLGNYSFGIYLAHIIILKIIIRIPGSHFLFFPLKTIAVVSITYAIMKLARMLAGKKLCGYIGF